MGNVNQVTPDGNLTYDQTGSYTWTDPYTNQTYTVPQFTATQTLSDAQQALKNQSDAAELNLAGLANQQSSFLQDYLARPFTLDGAPQPGDPSSAGLPQYQQFGSGPDLVSSLDGVGNVQTGLMDAGDITRSYETDFSADRQRVEDALMARMNPHLERDRASLEQRLANQGLQPGSEAYNRAIDEANRSASDARYGAILSAGQEQSRLAGLANQSAAFQNSAQQQAYNQILGSGSFANAAQAQQYDQSLGQAGLYNTAQQQMADNAYRATAGNNALQDQNFNAQMAQMEAQNAARNQWMQEQFAARGQPINEITALLSGSQVSQPNFINPNIPQIPTADNAAIIGNYDNQRLQAWQAQQAQMGGIFGGLLGLGSKLIGLSDDDAKKDKKRLGDVDGEMGLWEFRYKGEPKSRPKHIGLMASEVQKEKPKAIRKKDGLRYVDYGEALGLMGAK